MDAQHVHGLVPLLFYLLRSNLGGAALGKMDLDRKKKTQNKTKRKHPAQHHPTATGNVAKGAWRSSAARGKTNFPGRNPRESGLRLLICKPRLFSTCLLNTSWQLVCCAWPAACSTCLHGQPGDHRHHGKAMLVGEKIPHDHSNREVGTRLSGGHQHTEMGGFGAKLGRVQVVQHRKTRSSRSWCIPNVPRVRRAIGHKLYGQLVHESWLSNPQNHHRNLVQGFPCAFSGAKKPSTPQRMGQKGCTMTSIQATIPPHHLSRGWRGGRTIICDLDLCLP